MKPNVGAVIAVAAPVLVAAALVGAGLYAVFGKPTSHAAKQLKQHVIHGFQLGGGIVLGIILMGSLVAFPRLHLGSSSQEGFPEQLRFSLRLPRCC
jgi:hypothetical protein